MSRRILCIFLWIAAIMTGLEVKVLGQGDPTAPTYLDQRRNMDLAALTFQQYEWELKVPHLDPAALSEMLVNQTLQARPDFAMVIAHRGYHSEPNTGEHTPASIMAAYHAGSDGIEIDTKASQSGFLVLGHDFTMGRETTGWPGAPSSTFNALSIYPRVDPFYANLPKANKWDENATTSNPANPRRNLMSANTMWYATVLDNFNNISRSPYVPGNQSERQMTLYEAMYFISMYAPMQIWVDVKGWDDIREVGSTVTQLRSDLTACAAQPQPDPKCSAALRVVSNVFIKLSYGNVIKDPQYENGISSPLSSILNVPGMYYFLVFGSGDLADLTTLGGGDTLAGYHKFCRIQVGCVGNEYGYKYPDPGSASDSFQNALLANHEYMASFHNSPPYLWYWWKQPNELDKAATWGRWYVRGDGSCCANRYDVLGYVPEDGSPETDDLRPSANVEEDGYQAITTDNTMEVLRDLQRKNRRPLDLMQALATSASASYPTGGANIDSGLVDGVYVISGHAPDGKQYYLEASTSPVSSPVYARDANASPLVHDARTTDFWFLKKRDSHHYTLQAALPASDFLGMTQKGSSTPQTALLPLVAADSGDDTTIDLPTAGNLRRITSVWWPGDPGHDLLLSVGGFSLSVSLQWNVNGATQLWYLQPITPPFPEKSATSVGPRGTVYCGDAGQDCQFQGNATIAYGNATDFTIAEQATSRSCNDASFGVQSLTTSVSGCFYSPIDSSSTPWPQGGFVRCASEGGTCQVSGGPVAFGSAALHKFTYLTTGPNVIWTCRDDQFDKDPAPGEAKECFTSTQSGAGPSGFSLCALEHEICDFTGTGAIAFGVPGSKSFVFKTFGNAARCELSSFAVDPAPGTVKACYYLDVSLPKLSDYQFMADEGGGIFKLRGEVPYTVLFGAGNSFTTQAVTPADYIVGTGVACTVTYFGADPAPGVSKHCFVTRSTNPHAFLPCAKDQQQCSEQSAQMYMYAVGDFGSRGANPTVDYKVTSDPVFCGGGSDGFARDPHPGAAKACWYAQLSPAQQAPPHFTFCATEGNTCAVAGIKVKAAFGINGKFTYVWGTNPATAFTCEAASFNNVNPALGQTKACYVYLYD